MKGIVNWYKEKDGYGFITGEDGKDVFVYKKALHFLTLLNAGDMVEYQIQPSNQGSEAVNLKKM